MLKVSIVTPSYNQGQFIEDTIKSVLSQDYPNIEYIIMDGGSTDNTLEILKKYEGKLKWVSEKDNGQADAINKGFKMASGDIFAWLNSDDTYLPGAVSKAVNLFNSNPEVELIYGKVYYTDMFGKITGEFPTEPFDYNRFAALTFICQPATFFKSQVYWALGGLDTSLHYTMDYDLWIRITQKYKIQFISEFMATYRLHGDSKTVSEHQTLAFLEENIKTAQRYYGRAPLNRVYGYTYNRVLLKLPQWLRKITPLVVLATLFSTIKEYIKLNNGISIEDLKLLTPGNIKKILTGTDGRPRG